MSARRSISWRRSAAAALALGGLCGCAAAPAVMTTTTAVSAVSLTSTKKTLTDHIVSSVVGRDCSVVSLEETGSYCPEQVVVDRSNLYCYRTLAAVECHTLPDPYKNSQTALASPPPIRKPVSQRGLFD